MSIFPGLISTVLSFCLLAYGWWNIRLGPRSFMSIVAFLVGAAGLYHGFGVLKM